MAPGGPVKGRPATRSRHSSTRDSMVRCVPTDPRTAVGTDRPCRGASNEPAERLEDRKLRQLEPGEPLLEANVPVLGPGESLSGSRCAGPRTQKWHTRSELLI